MQSNKWKESITLEKRETSYEEINYLKGFSILTIIIYHFLHSGSFPSIVDKIASMGGSGVHIFFFCSGFGLYTSYLKHKTGYLEFMKKRFIKIYLPYIFVVAVSAFLPYMFDGDHLKAFLSHLFLYKMFVPQYEESFGVFWYISTLFQFYLIFIPFVRIKDRIRNSNKFVILCFLISVSWWILTAYLGISEERIWGSFFLQYLWEFGLGIYIAELLYRGNVLKITKKELLFVGFFGMGIAAMMKIMGGPWNAFNDIFSSFGYGSSALLLYSIGIKRLNRFVNFTSSISYELYLLHILVSRTMRYLVTNWYLAIVLSVLLTYITAFLYHKLFKVSHNILFSSY